jgi:hypothetical protein
LGQAQKRHRPLGPGAEDGERAACRGHWRPRA